MKMQIVLPWYTLDIFSFVLPLPKVPIFFLALFWVPKMETLLSFLVFF